MSGGYNPDGAFGHRIHGSDKAYCEDEKDGKFGRMLGWLYKSDEDTMSINQIMIDKGYARAYDGTLKKRTLDLLAKGERPCILQEKCGVDPDGAFQIY